MDTDQLTEKQLDCIYTVLCLDKGLYKTETHRLPKNYVPLTIDYSWFYFLLTLLFYEKMIEF